MKEKIYTIPVNEAYDTDCECPLCVLEKQLEDEAVQYSLGAAMMEPDFRIDSNELGYCNRHFSLMFKEPKKLPLALILDTHLDDVRKKLDSFSKSAQALTKEKSGFFKKSNSEKIISDLHSMLDKNQTECLVCKKINHTMERYIDVLLYLWANEDEFKSKFDNSKGVCLRHFDMLVKAIPKSLKGENADHFLAALIEKEQKELARIQEDIHKFTLKFDYRNKDMEWGTAKDAPIRTIEKLSGFINKDNEN